VSSRSAVDCPRTSCGAIDGRGVVAVRQDRARLHRHPGTGSGVARAIRHALADARSVVNVGAGTGAYEPADLDVVAVEPSAVMLAQRPPEAAPGVHAAAEALPLADDSFDAALAVLSDHHWRDRVAGLRELRRVARDRVVLFNADPAEAERFWLTTEYLPAFLDLIPPRIDGRVTGRTSWSTCWVPCASRLCRSPTTAETGSTAPTGGGPRHTSTRKFGGASQSSLDCPSLRSRAQSVRWDPTWRAAPGGPDTRDSSSSMSLTWATASRSQNWHKRRISV